MVLTQEPPRLQTDGSAFNHAQVKVWFQFLGRDAARASLICRIKADFLEMA